MRISEHTLKDAWQQLAEACGLPDAAVLPPTGSSPEQYGRHVGDPGGLFLVVDGDGTVRGHRSPYQEVFATRDLDLALYFAAEEAVGGLAGDDVAETAARLEAIDPAWGRRFRSGGSEADGTPAPPCGSDPPEGLAWIAGTWRDQVPYTCLAFFRGRDLSAEQIALAHGADPGSTAAGTSLADLREAGCNSWESCCFGQSGDWVRPRPRPLLPGRAAGLPQPGDTQGGTGSSGSRRRVRAVLPRAGDRARPPAAPAGLSGRNGPGRALAGSRASVSERTRSVTENEKAGARPSWHRPCVGHTG